MANRLDLDQTSPRFIRSVYTPTLIFTDNIRTLHVHMIIKISILAYKQMQVLIIHAVIKWLQQTILGFIKMYGL
jgi:hypothetical protein